MWQVFAFDATQSLRQDNFHPVFLPAQSSACLLDGQSQKIGCKWQDGEKNPVIRVIPVMLILAIIVDIRATYLR